ncbi:MAG: hypothetical protein UX13_C0016G0019 [Candidatus Woesebacteria bacterium GW2011_GWB1_45_5]|uniref:Integral membrane protein n=1 Tax=Candidatus Woesebacteria bacterium GW2011_GWB1_45_5 TaxID=1618581 RepID=A0A0G1MQ74_9BACT|nr:MAG: hypothetical protein UX13_C0016G0019 [Candidatus Woesebacteria bacterium GW2011_GWB1_45_5]
MNSDLESNMIAQNLDSIQSGAGINLPFSDIGGLIGNILPYVFGAAAIALLIYLISGGFQLMTSQGDPKAIQGAQGKITNALIGFVIVFTAFLIVQIIGEVLDLGAFSLIFQ